MRNVIMYKKLNIYNYICIIQIQPIHQIHQIQQNP